ncbi:hypothetical protein V8D89_009030 [Ganoderma adspersum]
MPAQTHAAPAISIQGDSPTPLHLHLHLQSQSRSQSPAQAHSSIKHLTGEVLATAHQLQQQIRTLECLAHATEEREATLVQQRAKLQELLRLVTQMETAEVRATASLRDTLARVHAGRDRGAAALAALRLAGASASASPGASPCAGQGQGLGESSSVVSPSPLGGSGGSGTRSGGGGGGGDADPVDNLHPESPSARSGAQAEEREANGGGERVGQPSGEAEGADGASEQAGSSSGHEEAEDASQPLPQFTSLRVKTEDEESGGAPQEVVDAPLPQANAVTAPGASEPGVVDRDHGSEDGRTRGETEHGAEEVKEVKDSEALAAGDGRGEACRPLDRRPMSAPGGTTETKGSPVSSRQGNEPTDAAAGSDGSWRARKRLPGRNAKEQMRGASAEGVSRQEGSKTKGAQGDIDGQAGGHQKRGGQRTPSPKKDQVPGDRVQPSPPKKAGESSPVTPGQGFWNVCGVLTNCLPPKVKAKWEWCAGTEQWGRKRVK